MHQPCSVCDSVVEHCAEGRHDLARVGDKVLAMANRIADLERENRRLRIRLGLATGTVTRWEDDDGPMSPECAVSLNSLRADKNKLNRKPIRLGDGRAEQELG